MLESLATLPRRLVIDTSLGQPARCLDVLVERIELVSITPKRTSGALPACGV